MDNAVNSQGPMNEEGKDKYSQDESLNNGHLDSYTACALSGFPNVSQEDLARSKMKKKVEGKSEKQEDPNDDVCSDTTKLSVPIADTTSSVKPFNTPKSPTTYKHLQIISKRWREKFEKLVSAHESKITRVGCMMYINDSAFCIAKGSDGIEVFLGLRYDGTEIAIKRIPKFNHQVLKNEEKILRLPELDQHFIIRYVDAAEDENFGYLGVLLCEYTLEEYIKDCPEDKLYQIVHYILKSVKVLQGQNPPIFHWDLKPQNFWIDVTKRVRLAGFGLYVFYTGLAGTQTLTVPYNESTDIKALGKLISYIISRGHYPFGEIHESWDVLANDLIESMIDEEPKNRPSVEKCLNHGLFWSDEKKEKLLIRTGNRTEVAKYKEASEELISSLDPNGSYGLWKDKFPQELVQKMDGKKKEPCYSDNAVALLRFIRNAWGHFQEYMDKIDLKLMFPNFFGFVYKFSKSHGWDLHMSGASPTRGVMPPTNSEEHLSISVEECSFVEPIAKALPQ